jgi:general secretion pathway protein G
MNVRMKKKNMQGFTLLEVLVSATIITVLTVIGVVSYGSVNKRSRDVKRKSDIEQIRSALEMYRSDNGGYPAVNTSAFGNASALDAGGLVATYMPSVPADPQPSQYNYFYAATNFDATTSKYYGYCICGFLETQSSSTSTCLASDIPGGALPITCNYGLKSP